MSVNTCVLCFQFRDNDYDRFKDYRMRDYNKVYDDFGRGTRVEESRNSPQEIPTPKVIMTKSTNEVSSL